MKRCFVLFMICALMLSGISVYAAEEEEATGSNTLNSSENDSVIYPESLEEEMKENQEVQVISENDTGSLDGGSKETDDPTEIADSDDNTFVHEEKSDPGIATIIGTLQQVNLNDFSVQIDNIKYPVGDDVDLNRAMEILLDEDCKLVGIILEEGQVISLSGIESLIYPEVKLSSDIKNLTYSNGKIDNSRFKCTANISWAIERPYKITDLEHVEDDRFISLTLDEIHLETVGALYFEKGGLFSPNKIDIYKKINMTLKPGEAKDISFDVFVEDDYIPENTNESLSIEASVMLDDFSDHIFVPVGNIDLQREAEEAKKAKRESTKVLTDAVNELSNINMAIDDSLLNDYFTRTQVQDIHKQMNIWVSQIVAASTMIREDEDGVIDTILKKSGLDQDSIMKKTLGKLGVNENVLTTVSNTKATTRIFVPQNNITVYCSIDLRFNAFKEAPPYAGFGTLNYYIIDDGKKKKPLTEGMIAYTDIITFTKELQEVAKSTIKSAYGDVWGKNADKVAEMIAGETICKILKKTTGGTFSDNLFTLFENQTTNYTKKMSIHCPVDVYIYDSEGNICGAIENNIVDAAYDSIFMYTEGDEKYIYLTEDDYTVQFVGNDTGKMTYVLEEYADQNLLRSIEYADIPLSKGKEYYSSIPDAVYLDHVVYDLISGMDTIPASSDGWQDNMIKRVSVSGVNLNQEKVSLDIGKEYQLTAEVNPGSATIQLVEWKSLDETIATVSNDGMVKAVGKGEVSIEAWTVDGGFTAECKVIVNERKSNASTPQISDHTTLQMSTDALEDRTAESTGNPAVSINKNNVSENRTSVQTGDRTMVVPWVLSAIFAFGACVILEWKHHSSKK